MWAKLQCGVNFPVTLSRIQFKKGLDPAADFLLSFAHHASLQFQARIDSYE